MGKAKEKIVAATMHLLSLEINEAGKELYEAKLLVKPWLNLKEGAGLKLAVDDAATISPSDLGCKKITMHMDGGKFQEMIYKCNTFPDHAVKTIQEIYGTVSL